MTLAPKPYIAIHSLACRIAVALIARERKSLVILQTEYRQYLSSRWKLITVAAATLSMTVMAPYTVDPTWDDVDA